MDFDLSGSGRSFRLAAPLGDSLPGGVASINWRITGVLGVIVGALLIGQLAAGALAGAGVTWGSVEEWRYGPGVSSSVMPDITLGSKIFYARAGAVLHVSCDADIRVGSFHLWLWRLAGLDNSPSKSLKTSGVVEFDFPIRESGFYKIMYVADRKRLTGSFWTYGSGEKLADLGYKLSWKLER